MSARRPVPGLRIGGVAVAVAVAVVGLVVWRLQALPDGPVEIAWDHEACAHCHMHVGEPRFAAQLQLTDGRIFNFDDPGCALRYVAENPRLKVHALWFHDSREDRWRARSDIAFVAVGVTPMGYGLGAVAPGTDGALSFDAATARVLERSRPSADARVTSETPSWP